MYRNFKFKKQYLNALDFDYNLQLNFSNENNIINLKQNEFLKKLQICLEHVNPGFECDNSPIFLEFIEDFYNKELEIIEQNKNSTKIKNFSLLKICIEYFL